MLDSGSDDSGWQDGTVTATPDPSTPDSAQGPYDAGQPEPTSDASTGASGLDPDGTEIVGAPATETAAAEASAHPVAVEVAANASVVADAPGAEPSTESPESTESTASAQSPADEPDSTDDPSREIEPGAPDQPESEPEPGAYDEPEPEPEPDPVVVGSDDLAGAVAAVREAVRNLGCVVIPTDTVYGIGANAFSPAAVQALLDAKQRGRDMPPPVLIADAFVLDTLVADVPYAARALAEAHWPGPLTLILKAHDNLRMDLGETEGTIAVRVPDHEVARAILRTTGPLAVSSANVSGKDPATSVADAVEQLRNTVAVYVDAGPTPGSVPSTIVDFTQSSEGRIVRVGVLSHAALAVTVPALVDVPSPEPAPEPSAEPDSAESESGHDPSAESELTAPVATSDDTATPEGAEGSSQQLADSSEPADELAAGSPPELPAADHEEPVGPGGAAIPASTEWTTASDDSAAAAEGAAVPVESDDLPALADLVPPAFDDELAGAPWPIPEPVVDPSDGTRAE